MLLIKAKTKMKVEIEQIKTEYKDACNLKELSKKYNLLPLTASTPAMTSLWPAINFVAECITMSGRRRTS